MLHRDKLRCLNPDTPETRTLQFLVEERRKFVHEKTRCSNRLTAHRKMYFPQALDWFDEIGSNIAAEFLERWPSIENFSAPGWRRSSSSLSITTTRPGRIKQRLEQIRKAVPATTDSAVVTSSSTAIVAWAGVLKQSLLAVTAYDRQIHDLARAHPGFAIVKSFPGAGPAMARGCSLRSEVNVNDTRVRPVQRYSGIAPVVASSGKQHWVHWRWACPEFFRQTFHEWALHSIAYSDRAREFYEKQRAKGKRRNTAIRSLAFKWIRILFRCWKDRVPYDETVYKDSLTARRTRQQPTAASCGTPVEKTLLDSRKSRSPGLDGRPT